MAGLGNPGGMAPQAQQQPMADDQAGPDAGGGQSQASPKEQAALQQFVETMYDVLYPKQTPGQIFPQILNDLQGNIDKQALAMFDGVQPPLTNSPQDSVSATAVILTLIVDQKMGLLQQAMQQRAGQMGGAPAPAPASAPGAPQPMEAEPGEEQPGQPEEDKGPPEPGEVEDEFEPDAVLAQGGKEAVEELIEVCEALKIHDFTEDEVNGAYLRALDLFRVAMTKVNPQLIQFLSDDFARLIEADKAKQGGGGANVLPGLPGGAPMPQQQGA